MSQTCHKRYSFLTIISSLLFPHFTWIHLKKKRGEDSEFRALSGFKLEDLAVQLQERGGKDLATAAILDMARQAGLSVNDQKALLGFSSTSWKDVAPRFKLDPSKDMNQLQYFSLPIAQLSPSFHREVMVASAKWLDVFQESGGEAAQMRLMGAVCVTPICVANGSFILKVACSCVRTVQRPPC